MKCQPIDGNGNLRELDKMKAIWLGSTAVAGVKKNRWECPNCRKLGNAECRFNLSIKKVACEHKCRYCGITLDLEKPAEMSQSRTRNINGGEK